MMFLKNMALLLEKTDPALTKHHILPMIFASLDLNNVHMQVCDWLLHTGGGAGGGGGGGGGGGRGRGEEGGRGSHLFFKIFIFMVGFWCFFHPPPLRYVLIGDVLVFIQFKYSINSSSIIVYEDVTRLNKNYSFSF